MGEYIRKIRVHAEIDTNKMTYSSVETVHSFNAGEEAVREFFDGYREEFYQESSLLDQAMELVKAALLLRMHGDITHLPMTQQEWDAKAEAFIRENEEI